MDHQDPQHSPRDRLLEHLPVDERHVDVGGIATAVLEGGQGPPLILIHGGTQAGALLWRRVLPDLCDSYRVIAPDLPGFGTSEPMSALDAAAFGQWLRRLIEATCHEPPSLVAHSAPAALAARFAAEHGELLRRQVLVDATGLGPFRPPPAFLLAVVRFNIRPSPRNLERFNRWPYLDPDHTRRQDRKRHEAVNSYLLARAAVPHVKRAMRQLIKAGTKPIPDAELRRIDVPTALIWGRHDRMAPLRHAHTASTSLGWPLHTIDDAGHLPHVEQPNAFVGALVNSTDAA